MSECWDVPLSGETRETWGDILYTAQKIAFNMGCAAVCEAAEKSHREALQDKASFQEALQRELDYLHGEDLDP